MKLSEYARVKKITPGTELHKILQIWAGSCFLNLHTHTHAVEIIKTEMLSIARRNLDERGMGLFEKYLDKYFNTTGAFRISRSLFF